MPRAVVLPSLCWNRNHADFYAVTADVSRDGIRFRSATVPGRGDRLTCSIRHVGSIEVRIVRTGVNTFTARPTSCRRRSSALLRTLMDLSRRQDDPSARQRAHPRIVPLRTDLRVTMEDGSILSGRIVNVSASGAAVHLGLSLATGTAIRLGSTDAVVVRAYADGVGASFRTPFDPDTVNEAIVL